MSFHVSYFFVTWIDKQSHMDQEIRMRRSGVRGTYYKDWTVERDELTVHKETVSGDTVMYFRVSGTD